MRARTVLSLEQAVKCFIIEFESIKISNDEKIPYDTV